MLYNHLPGTVGKTEGRGPWLRVVHNHLIIETKPF